jgi:endonuclease/exonuclease/phosphatase family metal-dependent hydrolase
MLYWLLKSLIPEAERKRVVTNLAALRAQLDAEVPPKNAESDLLLATWNLRDFDKDNRRGWGERFPESHFYIAEVLSRFDFVAVQEVNRLGEWEQVTRILGPSWDWIATDVTEGPGGNGERLTYLYDTRKVRFQNIAGEIVLPASLLITANVEPKSGDKGKIETSVEGEKGEEEVGKQFRRTPFAALFQAAWFRFEICTVHIYYGEESGKPLEERIEEIGRIGEFFGKRAEEDFDEKRSLILLGDFNIVGRDHKTMKALLDSGFEVPKALREAPPTNAEKDKFYDQIAFRTRPGELEYLESAGKGADARAGSVDIFKNVYTADQFDDFKAQVDASDNAHTKDAEKDPLAYYLDWRTYQFSDHAPLWVRLQVNDSGEYLKGLIDG